MNFIYHIVLGWWYYATNKRKDLVAKRKPICDKCPMKSKHNFCNDCGCFLPAKQRVEDAVCPMNKWTI